MEPEPRKSSRKQENTSDLVDRISALPDSILGLILSCLPTENAVATSILSKRWRFLWMTVHTLDFCYEVLRRGDEANYMKFIRFVNRVLLLHGGKLLNKFRLFWKTWDLVSHSGYTRNVHELVFLCDNRSPEPLEMPSSLFNCSSLQSLELDGSIYVNPDIEVSLPRLETLKLVLVEFHSQETFRKIIGGCPMLDYLHVVFALDPFGPDEYDTKYIISSPSLRRLFVCDDSDMELTRTLVLETSSLKYLKLYGYITQVFVQRSLSSLVEADLEIYFEYGQYLEENYNLMAKAVRSLDCAKALTISYAVMWALSNATISLSTKFTRLTKLEARVVCCYCSSLHDFLQCSDSLEVLTISKHNSGNIEYDHDHSNWTAPVDVPKCLSNSLKKVSFECYTGCDDEREMIGYLLKHGSALEVMQIAYSKDNFIGSKIELVKEIRGLPRKLPTCKVEFIE